MKRLNVLLVIIIIFLTIFIPVISYADLGPKPSVNISFENMGDEECFATLLSSTHSTGPYSTWKGDGFSKNLYGDLTDAIWNAFAEYEDNDGYYFLQVAWNITKTKNLTWGYYPPDTFKILLYYPETEIFVASDIYESYAFDTYYTTYVNNGKMSVTKSYQYGKELISLTVRIIFTILIEMGVALLFGFKSKKSLRTLAVVNSATQILLNVALNIINFSSGQRAFMVSYVLFEILVIVIESVLYCKILDHTGKKLVLYAMVANVVSFCVGLAIALYTPGIF